MSGYAVCNYVWFRRPSTLNPDIYEYGPYKFQNFFVNATRTHNVNSFPQTYEFAPFALATGSGEKGGDRSTNTLVTGASTEIGATIILNLFRQAVDERWLLEVETVSLDPSTFADDQLISTETWRVGSYEMDTKTITLRLISPLDAVQGQVPNRRLTEDLVGALHTTGSFSLF